MNNFRYRSCRAATAAWLLWALAAAPDLVGGETPRFVGQFRGEDAAAGDEFGRAVALAGSLGIVGAPSRNEAGAGSGAAYLFDVLSGRQLMKLVPDDGQAADAFGSSVAIQGDRAVVGAMFNAEAGRSAGAAYVFDITTGQQLHKLIASDAAAGHEFGVAVDLDRDQGIVLVGAHKNGPGAAYLFDLDTGSERGVLQAEDAAPNDLFGVAVALDQGKALIGARYDDDAAIASGSAYLFDIQTQQQLHKLTPHDGDRGDRFGMHLDLGGNRAVVGSRYDDDAVKSSGSAYVYDVETGQELFKLVAGDATPNDQFGSAISVSGGRVLIGALDDDHNGDFAGSAYLFDVNTGEQLYKFDPDDAAPFDRLGIAVAMDRQIALLGASMINLPGAPFLPSGRAYVYVLPEPSTAILSLCGAWGCFACRRRLRRLV
jgi:outer membrane protein assembly factor BamB